MSARSREAIVDTRVNKVLALRADSSALLDALNSIGEFYTENTAEARRSLRHDLEKQNIDLAQQFVESVSNVSDKVSCAENKAHQLETSCESLASHVASADKNMKVFMERASELENKRSQYLQQAKEVESFLLRFQLSKAEVDALYNTNLDYGASEFFSALNRLLAAFSDCTEMVEGNRFSVAGVELLDRLGEHRGTAYRRLFEWVKAKCEVLTEYNSPSDDVDNTLQKAIRYLQHLPIYYDQCVDLLVSARRTQLVQKFIIALTQGGGGAGSGSGVGPASSSSSSSLSSRAMDSYAHDTVRYVGDMLAWMHCVMAAEKEFLSAVFGLSASVGPGGGSGSRKGDRGGENDPRVSVSNMLSRCLQGLGRPLRSRLVQAMEDRHNGVDALYAVADLLCFYEAMFGRMVPQENAVHSTVKGCLGECRRIFVGTLNRQATSVSASVLTYTVDLSPVYTTRECGKQLREILRVFAGLMSNMSQSPTVTVADADEDGGDKGAEGGAEGVTKDEENAGEQPNDLYIDNVLGNVIQPILQACRQCSSQSLEGADAAVFMLNNVYVLLLELQDGARSSVACKKATETWINLLNSELTTWEDVLVREETARTLRRSDLDQILDLIEVLPATFPAAEQPGLSAERVCGVVKAFYDSVFTSVILSAHAEKLSDAMLRSKCRARIAGEVAQQYEKVYRCVSTPSNGYKVQEVLPHTVDEVKVLLGCADAAKANEAE